MPERVTYDISIAEFPLECVHLPAALLADRAAGADRTIVFGDVPGASLRDTSGQRRPDRPGDRHDFRVRQEAAEKSRDILQMLGSPDVYPEDAYWLQNGVAHSVLEYMCTPASFSR